ncbi:MAG TPA: GNAT family N-acetyltransferase [Vicinamibacterales bacterium]
MTPVLRPMTIGDIPAGLRLCRASGWNQLARDWEHFLTVNPGGARVIEKDGDVVGTVTTLRYGPVGWVAMVLVDPAERRQGFGSRLLTAALDLLADVPSIALDATPLGEPIYRSHGFVEVERISRMTGPAPATGLPPSSPAVRPMQPSDLPRVAEWDAGAFGRDRRALLEWLHAGAPGYAWVAESSGRLTGYVLGRHGFNFEQLGPICAEEVGIAIALAAACLEGQPGRTFAIDARHLEPGWIAWLESIGFREQRPFTRMARNPLPRGDLRQRFATAGPELG